MKNILLFSILFCAIVLPALGELTDVDLDKIRLIVNEEIKKEITTTNTKIDGLDTRLRNVETDIAELRGTQYRFFTHKRLACRTLCRYCLNRFNRCFTGKNNPQDHSKHKTLKK